jgi:hypothetical protein
VVLALEGGLVDVRLDDWRERSGLIGRGGLSILEWDRIGRHVKLHAKPDGSQ